MMSEDFGRFEALIRKLEDVYSKKFTDDAMQAYWRALRDLPFEQVSERVSAHIRYSKFSPKPVELRPKEDRPREKDAANEAAFREAERRANVELDEMWGADHDRWVRLVSEKVYELGRARGMLDGQIAQRIRDYRPVWAGKCAHN